MSAANLAGLTPEQVAQVAATDLSQEQLRQQAVGQLLNIPGAQSSIALQQAQIKELQGRPALQIQLENIKRAKSPEEIAKIKSEIFQNTAAGILSTQRAGEINSLLDAKIEAGRLGNEKLQKDIDSLIEVLFPSTEEGEVERGFVPATDLARFLTQKEVAEIGAGGRGGAADLAERKFATTEEQTAVDIEKEINEKPKSPTSLARYPDFNRYTNRSKLAVNDGGKVKYVPLGKINGKTVTGRRVYEAAKSFGMTVDELYQGAKAADVDVLEYLDMLVKSLPKQ